MQTAKQSLLFKHFTYEIQINPMGQKRLSISIIDSSTKSQFFQKQLVLQHIGVSTLVKAFQKAKKQISFTIDHKKGGEIQMIQLKVIVQSQFLRPVQQKIFIKKLRDVSQTEALKKSIDYLNKKMKDLKTAQEADKKDTVLARVDKEPKMWAAGNTFQTFSQITLPKGKHIITWTFFAKATNSLFYIYLNSGQITLLTNCAIYVPNTSNFIPFTLRKVHTVTTNQQTLNLQSYCTQSYPVTISNCIVTAKKIN